MVGENGAGKSTTMKVVADRNAETTPVAKSTGAASDFSVGDRVFHQKFGYGAVRAVDGDRLELEVVARGWRLHRLRRGARTSSNASRPGGRNARRSGSP